MAIILPPLNAAIIEAIAEAAGLEGAQPAVTAAQAAADTTAATVANAAPQATTLAALTTAMGALPDGSLGVVYTGTDAGNYRKTGGVLVLESRTIPQVDVAAAAASRAAAGADASIYGQTLTTAALPVYTGADVMIPEVLIRASNVEQVARGRRVSDGAEMHWVPLAGPGFTDAVRREMAGLIETSRFVGGGTVVPVITIGDYAVVYFDKLAGRLVLNDVLIRGDSGIVAQGGASSDVDLTPRDVLLSTTGINGCIPYGQSLSVGAMGQPALSLTQPYSNVSFVGGPKSSSPTDQATFAPLIENNLAEGNNVTSNRGETICSGLANYAVRIAAEDAGVAPSQFVIFASTPGQGGMNILQLSKGTPFYTRFLEHVTAAFNNAATLGKAFVLHAVPWLQGEADITDGTLYADYRSRLVTLQSDIEADVQAITGQASPVWLIPYQSSYGVTISRAISTAIFDETAVNDGIALMGATYQFPYADGIHMTNVGYAWLGAYFGRAYKQLVVEGRRPDVLRPISVTCVGTRLRIRFKVPTLPLVIDTLTIGAATDNGFVVQDDTGTLTLSNQLIINGDTWQATLNRSLGANPRARYAFDVLGTGVAITSGASGNLRDSTDETVLVDAVERPLWHWAAPFDLPVLKLV